MQRTYEKTLDSAHEQYDSEERAHRTAWAAVKHVAEKQGDHWELKDEKGPSDPQAAKSGKAARKGSAKTYTGVDAVGLVLLAIGLLLIGAAALEARRPQTGRLAAIGHHGGDGGTRTR